MKNHLLLPAVGLLAAAAPAKGALTLDFTGRTMDASLRILSLGPDNLFGLSSGEAVFGANGRDYRDFVLPFGGDFEGTFTLYGNDAFGGPQFVFQMFFPNTEIDSFQPGEFVLTITGLPEEVKGFEYSDVRITTGSGGPTSIDPANYPFTVTTAEDGEGNVTLTLTNSGVWANPGYDFAFVRLEGNFTAVPEPASLVLGALATGFMVPVRRRRPASSGSPRS